MATTCAPRMGLPVRIQDAPTERPVVDLGAVESADGAHVVAAQIGLALPTVGEHRGVEHAAVAQPEHVPQLVGDHVLEHDDVAAGPRAR